jgi:hypothetical protein
MEFLSRSGDRRAPRPLNASGPAGHPPVHTGRRKHIDWAARTVRLELFIIIVGSALILAALSLWLATGNFKSAESAQVNNSRYQAVFLTNNQVYFGKITNFDSKTVILSDVFYIETPNQEQSNTSAANSNYTLRKLGVNELHAPEDKMIISREQVIFWENLKDTSQVVTKIKEYKNNPSAGQQGDTTNPAQPSNGTQTPSNSTPNDANP